eukprot:541007-Prymnesium_polylepis.1
MRSIRHSSRRHSVVAGTQQPQGKLQLAVSQRSGAVKTDGPFPVLKALPLLGKFSLRSHAKPATPANPATPAVMWLMPATTTTPAIAAHPCSTAEANSVESQVAHG